MSYWKLSVWRLLFCLSERDEFIFIIVYNSNTILRKFRQDIKPTLNQVYRLMSNFLRGLIVFNSPSNHLEIVVITELMP